METDEVDSFLCLCNQVIYLPFDDSLYSVPGTGQPSTGNYPSPLEIDWESPGNKLPDPISSLIWDFFSSSTLLPFYPSFFNPVVCQKQHIYPVKLPRSKMLIP
jgi:hypothetical protein